MNKKKDPFEELLDTIYKEANEHLKDSTLYQIQNYQWKDGENVNDTGYFHCEKGQLNATYIKKLLSETVVSLNDTFPIDEKSPWPEGAYCMTLLWNDPSDVYVTYTTLFLNRKGSFNISIFNSFTNTEVAKRRAMYKATGMKVRTRIDTESERVVKVTIDGFFDEDLLKKLAYKIRGQRLANDFGVI